MKNVDNEKYVERNVEQLAGFIFGKVKNLDKRSVLLHVDQMVAEGDLVEGVFQGTLRAASKDESLESGDPISMIMDIFNED